MLSAVCCFLANKQTNNNCDGTGASTYWVLYPLARSCPIEKSSISSNRIGGNNGHTIHLTVQSPLFEARDDNLIHGWGGGRKPLDLASHHHLLFTRWTAVAYLYDDGRHAVQ